MTAAVLDRPMKPALWPQPDERSEQGELPLSGEHAQRRAASAHGGRTTLEERLDSILTEARTNGSTDCPLCHARMTPTPAGAACDGCGSRLS